MEDKDEKNEFSKIIDLANKKGIIKSYEDFIKTENAKKYALSEEEVAYYTSLNKE